MNSKRQIQKLRDDAELAQAAYGYFHLVDKTYKHNDKDEKRLNEFKDNFKKYKPNENQRDSPTLTYSTLLINTTLMIMANPKMASLMIGYLMATSPHSKHKDSFLAMIYSFINQILKVAFLLLYLVKKQNKRIQNLKRLAIQVNMVISIIP